MNFKQSAFSAVRWTAIHSVGKTALSIASVMILARILDPEDYGLMAMVAVVLGVAALFADLGVNSAFVQRQGVTHEQRSSLFWLNILMSVSLSLLVIAISPLFSKFFEDPRLTPLMMLSSSTFVLAAVGQQVKMSAEKELKFRAVVLFEILSLLIGFVIAVLAALAGWGVYSLVVSGIASTASATAFYWIFISEGWRPLWRLRFDDVHSFLSFGGAVVGNNVVNYINSTLDLFLGGRLLTAMSLGLYSVPRHLVLQLGGLVNAVITRVGFPLIAQVQFDVDRVRSIYLKTLNMTSSTNAPLYIGIAFFSPEIIALVLGAGWERSGELLRVLALWGGIRSTANPVGSLLYGMGRAALSLKWNLVLLLITPPALWLGAQEGPEGMAWALLLLQLVLFIPAWFFLVRSLCHARLLEYSVAALKPFGLAVLAVMPAWLLAIQFDGLVVRLLIGIVVSTPLYLTFSYLGNRDWIIAMMELASRPEAVKQA